MLEPAPLPLHGVHSDLTPCAARLPWLTPPLFLLTQCQVDAIVYLVDAADRERFPESQRELNGLLSDDGLSTVPFLVLGNKVGAWVVARCAPGLMAAAPCAHGQQACWRGSLATPQRPRAPTATTRCPAIPATVRLTCRML